MNNHHHVGCITVGLLLACVSGSGFAQGNPQSRYDLSIAAEHQQGRGGHTPAARGGFFGPSPYRSPADLPAGFYASGAPSCLQDFESQPSGCGLSFSSGVSGRGVFADSVDIDDGVVDGSGSTGTVFGHASASNPNFIEVRLSPPFPTAAGLVWTDGLFGGQVSFTAFDAGGVPLGSIGPFVLGGRSKTGQTDEDRFFGVHHLAGISAIRIIDTSINFEVDHIQWGWAPNTTGAGAPTVTRFGV